MNTLETILLILLVLNSVALGALVLLQQGKGADIGAAFGSGAASTVFGSSGSASFLAKLTTWLAIGFFLLSLGLAFIARERAANLNVDDVPVVSVPAPQSAPEQPAGDLPTAPAADGGNQDAAPQTLTPPDEPVDSDIPKV
jgi:preprotein translocase subunit SecG